MPMNDPLTARPEASPQADDDSRASSKSQPADLAPVSSEEKTVISNRSQPLDAPPPLATGPQQLGQSLVGKRLEHYDLDEFVGGGGMGAVFRATDTRLGRTVAVKVLSRDHTDEETIRRFRNEAQSAARLDHPNIARVYYVGEDHGWNFIVFEFIEGTNLRDAVERDGPLSIENSLRYTLQVAQALAHSSSRDVIHRDIKPSNVLVTADNQVKLVDMGLARLHQVESSSNDLTASGVTLGTFDYISPEQARDPRSADVRSDIYSLGCTLFYMLTGQPPFPDGTAVQKLLRHSSDEPPDVRIFRPEVPPQIAGLLVAMLAKRPTRRPQAAEELIAELLLIGEELGLRDLGHPGLSAVYAATRQASWLAIGWQVLAAAAVLVVAIVAVDTYLTGGGTDNTVLSPLKFKPPSVATDSLESQAEVSTESPRGISVKNVADGSAAPPLERRGQDGDQAASAGQLAAGSSRTFSATALHSDSGSLNVAADESSIVVGPPLAEAGVDAGIHDADPPAASAPPSPPAVTARPKRLVVTAAMPISVDPETEYVSSLAEACRRAGALGLTEIELSFNGPVLQTSCEVTLPRLTLRAAANCKPVLVFQPPVTDRQMIRLSGGAFSRLSVQNVELRLELPREPADGWALFAMGTGQTLELSSCVLTVQDGDAERLPVHDQVAMINVQPRRAGENMAITDPQPAMAQAATILLDRCIARGEATLVVMPDETPLSLRWNQGLLATSRRLIETGGSAADPMWFRKIDIDLEAITASCRQGLYQMRRGPSKSHQFAMNMAAKHSIFVTEPDTPLFEYSGVPALASDDLQSEGDYNRYPSPDVVFLRVRPAAAGETVQTFGLDRCQWSTENHSQVGIPWLRPPPQDVPAHTLTKADFATDASLPVGAGFDPALLPDAAPAVMMPAISASLDSLPLGTSAPASGPSH
jgi:serine/threonine protein kinase